MTTLSLPGPLVDSQWLADNIDHPNLVILDASSYMPGVPRNAFNEWQQQSIPGAHFFDFNEKFADTTSTLPHMLPSTTEFTQEARELGINQDSIIVVYDSAGIFSAPRAWWMLTTMGHKFCAVLDGGLPQWLAEARTTEPGEQLSRELVAIGNFTAINQPQNVKNVADISAAIRQKHICILDARSKDRFDGVAKEPREGLISGHIPSSKSLPFDQLLDKGKFKPTSDIKQLIDSQIQPDQQLYATCGSGITACVLAFAAHLVGIKNIAVYDGSWCEWGDPKYQLPIDSNLKVTALGDH
jgi:thiosulfate/3-mercaptopyruvate sulfurtransferase